MRNSITTWRTSTLSLGKWDKTDTAITLVPSSTQTSALLWSLPILNILGKDFLVSLKDWKTMQQYLRKAVELAPNNVGLSNAGIIDTGGECSKSIVTGNRKIFVHKR